MAQLVKNDLEDCIFDEFSEFERSSINSSNIRKKLDLGYNTMNYRTSLIPRVKSKTINMKKNMTLHQTSDFDRWVIQHVKTSDPFQASEMLLKEISKINTHIITAKGKLYKLIRMSYLLHLDLKKTEHLEETKEKSGESIFSQKVLANDFVAIQVSPVEILDKVIQHRRSPLYDELCFEVSLSDYPKLKSSQSPILVEENYYIEESFENPHSEDLAENSVKQKELFHVKKLNIYVLVHGLGGSSCDLLMYKNYISFVDPNSEFIISAENAGSDSEKDINILAGNLAKEIISDITFYDINNVDKISFVGYSLGGIIIRAALPLIAKYKDKFYSFISLASPHLGLKLKKRHIAAGLWFIKVFYNKKCLEQLNLDDSPNIEDTFMYKLSKSEGLSWFKKIYFFASSQDTYCPFGSARVQVFNDQMKDQNYSPEILQMAQNMLMRINAECLTRVNTNFYLSENYLNSTSKDKSIVNFFHDSIDKIIGRRAHCEFISNDYFAKMLVNRYRTELFFN